MTDFFYWFFMTDFFIDFFMTDFLLFLYIFFNFLIFSFLSIFFLWIFFIVDEIQTWTVWSKPVTIRLRNPMKYLGNSSSPKYEANDLYIWLGDVWFMYMTLRRFLHVFKPSGIFVGSMIIQSRFEFHQLWYMPHKNLS